MSARSLASVVQSPAGGAVAVILACLLTWSRTVHDGFVNYDTPWLVVQNPLLSTGDFTVIPTLFTDLSLGTRMTLGAEYLPLRDLSVLLDYALFGDWWLGHHLQNLSWYTAGCVGFLFVLRNLFGAGWPALLGALFFAVHPAHLECVGWLASRKDVMGLAFFWLAMLVGLRGGTGAWWSAPLALMAIWSKNLTITLPIILMVTVWTLHRERWSGRWSLAIPLHAAVVLCTLKISFWVGDTVQMTIPSRADGIGELVVLQGRMLVHYAGSLVWPPSLSPWYPEPDFLPLQQTTNAWGLTLYAGLLAAVPWFFWRGNRRAALGILWGLGTLAPVFQLVPLQNLLADRYLMLPLGGAALTLTATLPAGRITGWLSALVICLLSMSSIHLSPIWHSSEALWRTAAERYPSHLRSTVAWAGAVHERDPATARTIYEGALRDHSDSAQLHSAYGTTLLALGLEEPALAAWQHALSIDPTHKKSLHNQMVQLTRIGRAPEAIPLGQTLTDLYPVYVEGWDGLATTYIATGDGPGAQAAAERAVALAPHRAASWCNLGSAYFLGSNLEGARDAWQRCSRLDPENPYPQRGLEELNRRAE